MFIQSDGKKVLLKEQILYVCENVFCTVFANQRSGRGLVKPKCLTVRLEHFKLATDEATLTIETPCL